MVPLLLNVVEDAPEQDGHHRGDQPDGPEHPDSTFEGVESSHRPPIGQGQEVAGDLGRSAVPQAHIALAGLDQHLVEFQELLGEAGLVGQCREIIAVFAGDQFIEHLA